MDILGVFSSIEIFHHRNFFLDTVHGRKSSHMMASSHSGFFRFYHNNLHGVCPRTVIQPLGETTGLLISWGFFFLPRTIPTSPDRQGGGLLSDHPYGHNHLYSQSTDWDCFLQTYPRVCIFTYSPRTGTRSKCLPNPWGVTLMTEPNHRRRLHDAVGFFFYHDKQIHTQGYYITHSHPKSTDWCT